ncbi:MAG: endonuclease/exonuclease/phosphatase family protein [Desulfobacteraceae bacterium]|jgi:endonuclease/exonuclease/phosphatase family metal-dependent hydrolase
MTEQSLTITVMTMNLRFGLAEDGENCWANRKKAYPVLFKTHDPDFIGVQEANDFQADQLSDILENHGHIGERKKSADPLPATWQDNLIFFKKPWTCLSHKHYFLSNTPDIQSQFPGSQWPRQCIIGHCENNGHSLIHVNTHFDFASSVQEKSAELIINLLKDYPADIPTIITGDFNTSPNSETYALFMENGFRDLFENHHSSTFHGFTGHDLGGHIDWILFKGGLKGVDHQIVQEPFEGIYPSDHYPVKAIFEFV